MFLSINIIKEYFLLDIYDYFDGALHFYINVFVLLLGVALAACCFIITAYTRKTYAVYTQLLRHKAFDLDSAKTLAELHLEPSGIIKSTLARGNHFNKCIRRAGAKDADESDSDQPLAQDSCKKDTQSSGKPTPNQLQAIDFSKERFYIDTSVKFKNAEPPSYTGAIIFSLIFVFASVLLFMFMPDILALLSGINMFGK